jgi:hypothetical protein
MKTWPGWHPGQELKAAHLLGLEDYVLTRAAILDERCDGVDHLDLDVSLRVHLAGKITTVELRDVRGVTPGGYPVEVEADEVLVEQLDSGGDNATFDAAVEVNPAEETEKLALRLWAPGAARLERRHLDLGGFHCGPAGALQWVRRPLVRRFDALRPFDESWTQWVQPLTTQIETLVRALDDERPPYPLGLVALATEVQRFAFEWPTLTLAQLLRRLQMINWLRVPPKERAPLEDYLAADTRAMLQETAGQELPRRLGELLDTEVRHPQEEAQRKLKPGEDVVCTWADRFWEAKFLRPFAGGSVELYIPRSANPPEGLSVQNRELTYVRSVGGVPHGEGMLYRLGALPIKAGSVFRFRLGKVTPAALSEAEFQFVQDPNGS